MEQKEIKSAILQLLEDKAIKLGFKEKYLKSDFDLIDSGLVDSMSFLGLIGDLEAQFDIEIDFENLNPEEFTTLKGLTNTIHTTLQNG